MGKRKKSSRGPAKKQVQKLDTKFNCLFCNHENSVSCKLDKRNSIGSLNCKICGQSFQTRINALSQPVDVYSDWFDAVEEVNQGKASDSEEDEGSSSDYESDSDEEGTSAKSNIGGRIVDDDDDDDEAEYGEERSKRSTGALLDSDDE
ncbi:similar to Saccharomyces cerevisiae YKL160W ELF1 Transcription elongation factor that contains a conserved zinc finger domain [Maudiozyma barnettii]|uniref:Transcription elongation factor 1 homolog n=1 Tax=Maudiozyma barnettii TaxID=61262 RepID=A0A8H2ZFI1_9SACH|nr:Elf1p [Kazachstania barnettii]CAB4252385.1 similar to Saccharomyces cerevisiae YKL160W ELF1 Transcription elongation factor that contains a conserved zinc finger domain [Kazachstania barnettii]CAD1779120.1 similar to Saccharomyces cerevisiae YKL160W ELF1 Transcription elongation factor that contains a conserved zinc finger domain [Kazachstania barnettii]